MKKLIQAFLICSMILMMLFCPAAYAEKTLTFQWKHSDVVAGDVFELHCSTVSGEGYELLTEIPFVEAQDAYQETVDISIPEGGYYFVMRMVRGSDGDVSGWSNEVFWKPVSAPFELKLIFK